MQHRFIKTAIAMAISAMSCASMAATWGTVSVDGETVAQGIEEALKNTSNATVVLTGEANSALSVNDDKENVSIRGQNISFSSAIAATDTVSVLEGGQIVIGGEETQKLSLSSSATGGYAALFASNTDAKGAGPQITMTAKEVVINAAYAGIWLQNNTQTETTPSDGTHLTISADNTVIKAEGAGIRAFSNSQVDISGNLTVDAPLAIDTRGNSRININQDGKGKVVLNGDILFETPNAPGDAQNSGNIINSEVNLNLSSADSSWTGRAYQGYREKNSDGTYSDIENVELNADPYYGNVTDFTVSLSNGAQWNSNGDSFVNNLEVADGASVNMQADAKVLNVDAMNVDNATVSMQGGADQKVSVNTLKSKAATLNMNASTKDGKSVQTGKFEVLQSVEDGSDLDVQLSGITADDIEDPQAAMDSVKDSVVAKGATIDKTIAEGDVTKWPTPINAWNSCVITNTPTVLGVKSMVVKALTKVRLI